MKYLKYFLLLCIFGLYCTNAYSEGLYKVSNIKITAQAANAKKAREAAIEKAQIEAFKELVAGTSFSAADIAAHSADILSAAREFQILNESIAKATYNGLFDVYFSKSHVDKILSTCGIDSLKSLNSFLVKKETNDQQKEVIIIDGDDDGTALDEDSDNKPLRRKLVIPLLSLEGKTILWDEQNIWLKKWQDHANIASSNGMIIPLGNQDDIADTKFNILLANANSFKSMLARYHQADEVLIAFADVKKFKKSYKVTVSMKNLSTHHEHSYLKEYFEISGAAEEEMLSEAVYKVINLKPAAQFDVKGLEIQISDNIEIDALFYFNDFSQWLQLSKTLNKMPSILKITPIEFNNNMILLNLIFKSDVASLKKEIAKRGYELFEKDQKFIIKKVS